MERLSRGVYRQEIAAELKVSVKIITAAIRWWHEQHGLPARTAVTRFSETFLHNPPMKIAAKRAEA